MLEIPSIDVYHAVSLMVEGYYNDNPSGGSLHIALDDGNMESNHLEFCVECAKKDNDWRGLVLAKILLQLSMTQRMKIYSHRGMKGIKNE